MNSGGCHRLGDIIDNNADFFNVKPADLGEHLHREVECAECTTTRKTSLEQKFKCHERYCQLLEVNRGEMIALGMLMKVIPLSKFSHPICHILSTRNLTSTFGEPALVG